VQIDVQHARHVGRVGGERGAGVDDAGDAEAEVDASARALDVVAQCAEAVGVGDVDDVGAHVRG
jgi:hypothetical protein